MLGNPVNSLKNYPSITWPQFAVCNDHVTHAFEQLSRDLFICEYLAEQCTPHSDHNNPGVEVYPILEPPHKDGSPRRRISFQAKYFENNLSYSKIKESMQQAVNHFAGNLDVIYLFCNKTLTKTTKGYKDIEALLENAGIELIPVSNEDVLSLVRKHNRTFYYFHDRTRGTTSASSLVGTIPITSSVSEEKPQHEATTPALLLEELIKEKIQKCKDAICNLKFGTLKSELRLLTSLDTSASNGIIAFYQVILAIHDNEDFSEHIDNVSKEQKEEAYWLKNLSKSTRFVTEEEYMNLSTEAQVATLTILFSKQFWSCIVSLFKLRDRINPDALKAFDFHYGLSLFNQGDYDQAHMVLSRLYEQYREQSFKLYDVCARLNKANRDFIIGETDHEEVVRQLLGELDRMKDQVKEQIKANESLIAVIELQSCFHLGANEKDYLSDATVRFNSYSEKTRETDWVLLFAGMCYEMNGDQENATDLFSKCAWAEDETFAARYFTSLIDLKQPEKVIDAYEVIHDEIKTIRLEALYLLALYRLKSEEYSERLANAVFRAKDSLDDLFSIGFYVEDRELFDNIVLPQISALLPEALSSTSQQTKVGLIATLAQNFEVILLVRVLNSISDLHDVNRFAVHAIYKCLYEIATTEQVIWQEKDEIHNKLRNAELISDMFIACDIHRRDFIQIKLLCATASNMVFSMLKYSKELFEYTKDVQTARNIIVLLHERNETQKEEYEPYLRSLMESDIPSLLVTVAIALAKLGRFDEADFYAYKALYNLNGKDDFDVYKNLLIYNNNNALQRMKGKEVRSTIGSNMIVTLFCTNEETTWLIAMDSEADFDDKNNQSLGVDHISRLDPIYTKLLGSGKNQVLNLRGKSYKVVSFEPREFFASRYIFQKVQEHPEEFKGMVWVIATEDPQEMVKQILALSDHREHTEALVDAYNFTSNSLGIPLDFFVSGNYEKYIDAQRYLMHGKNQVYYAGEPRLEFLGDEKYIPTLSTLVLLASKGWLHALDWLGESIIIPESYLSFFRKQYSAEVGSQSVSVGSLIPLDGGKFTILDPDKKLPEIWESIINKCEKYPTISVLDDERISYEIVDGFTWERLFADAKMDVIQLDGLIVAEKTDGVYLCDDLFFRKIAAYKRIKHINFATILYARSNLDDIVPILLELTKTNYVYAPLRYRNNEEAKQLIENMLDGERKSVLHSAFLFTYFRIRKHIIDQYFGENNAKDG